MKQLDVYVDGNKCQHLAINNEMPNSDKNYNCFCGASPSGEVKKVFANEVKVDCKICQEQVDMIVEIFKQ